MQGYGVAIGAALGFCLMVAWPAQETIVKGIARARGASLAGDDLGDYTTNFVFPVVLLFGSWLIYRFTVRRLLRTQAASVVAVGSASVQVPSR